MFVSPGSRVGRGRFGLIGAGGPELLQTRVAYSHASLDFKGFVSDRYDSYIMDLNQVVPGTASAKLLLRMSTDGGRTFISSGSYSVAFNSTNRFGSGSGGSESFTSIQLHYSALANNAYDGLTGQLRLTDLRSTTKRKMVSGVVGAIASTVYPENEYVTGRLDSLLPVDAVQLVFDSGNVQAGSVRIFGVPLLDTR